MPGPHKKSIPKFESFTDPEELERFFSRLEELFDQCAVTNDLVKKKYTISYTDVKTEKQWKVLDYFNKGTFGEFKSKVLGSYDGAVDSGHDAVWELKKLVDQYNLLSICKKSDFMVFKREFSVLAAALSAVLLNQELVNHFLIPMSDELYDFIKRRLECLPVLAEKLERD
ncbi:hypothetical protein ARMGADRAFT_1034532 [Armillaria gallica]|uniref:Uncharacterized protein n=1 Tax=Armillaria gallica TaxID=47427 RepID=A0A2H3D1J1_ARMGA|nr:hypothetical protein ARMGADRAFT_1034532 [Armillaria gallica]